MTTSPVTKLTYGTRTLNLTTGRYRIDDDFVPPPYAQTPLISIGTSANKSGGALIDSTPTNRNFAFGLHVSGSSDAEVRRAVADLQMFLSLAGDESTPLYLEHKPNSDTPEPLWGNYGANTRYEVITGTATISNLWAVSDLRARGLPACQVNLVIKPHAVGLRQRLGSALGGIIEDNYGASDGVSRGLIVPEATTNLFTNPVFGNATYSTNWTIGSNLTAAQNTNTKQTLPGCLNSMRVYARNTTNNTVTESLTLPASSHTITAYVMLPDLTAPTSTQLQIYYNSAAQTTTYEAVGDNGLYRCYATVTGTGGALATGVVIKNKYTVYLLGMQVEAKAYPTPLCYGDLLGCSWSGTAHASTSARAVARMRVPIADDTYFRERGSFTITVKLSVPNTHANDMRLWFIDTSGALLDYQASTDKFRFYDGANIATSTAQTFSAGAIYTLHCTWGASGLALYVNGVADGSNATFTPTTTGSHFYIGVDSTPGSNTLATIMDFRTFDRQLTATEVANDYANVAQVTADNQRVGCIPWLWTKDGDDVVDNCDDSTRDNWAVCGGVPGSAEAVTEIDAKVDTLDSVWLSCPTSPIGEFVNPGELYGEASGTVDANSSGGQYETQSISTSAGANFDVILSRRAIKMLSGRDVVLFARAQDAGSNLTVAVLHSYYSTSHVGEYIATSAPAGAFRLIHTLPFGLQTLDKTPISSAHTIDTTAYLALQPKRTTGTANLSVDFVAVLPTPLVKITDTGGYTGFVMLGDFFQVYLHSTGVYKDSSMGITGNKIELTPDSYNYLISLTGNESNSMSITNTVSYQYIKITPRYTLL